MPCFHPLDAYQLLVRNANGKRPVVFKEPTDASFYRLQVACGRCIGCRLEYSRQWAIRCMHEASLHVENCFVTLTYADEHLPAGATLVRRDFTLFVKRLRKHIQPRKIKHYSCGEYGERRYRPHYHACIFGYDFPDKVYLTTKNGNTYWRSATLERLWPLGQSMLGAVTFESAAYVARYCTAKVTGQRAKGHYEIVDPETGEVFNRKPEFSAMSLRPAVGKEWLLRYQDETYRDDTVVSRGREMKPPKYYDRQYEIIAPERMQKVRLRREEEAGKQLWNNTRERLAVREEVKKASLSTLKREVE